VDGEEDIFSGLDLFEFSEVLVQYGAWQAVVRNTAPCLFVCLFVVAVVVVDSAVITLHPNRPLEF